MRLGFPWILVGFAGGLAATHYQLEIFVRLGFLAMMMIGAVILLRIFRCPSCGTVPRSRVPFNPIECPSCGVPLK